MYLYSCSCKSAFPSLKNPTLLIISTKAAGSILGPRLSFRALASEQCWCSLLLWLSLLQVMLLKPSLAAWWSHCPLGWLTGDLRKCIGPAAWRPECSGNSGPGPQLQSPPFLSTEGPGSPSLLVLSSQCCSLLTGWASTVTASGHTLFEWQAPVSHSTRAPAQVGWQPGPWQPASRPLAWGDILSWDQRASLSLFWMLTAGSPSLNSHRLL